MAFLDKIFARPEKKEQAIVAYNLGLEAKYAGRWRESFEQNKLAAKLNANDEATWWNLAIAATALHEWDEARRAWSKVGITSQEESGEVTTASGWACVRLDPDGLAEVVWGKRIDPARIVVKNIPLPETDRLYGDIILNDGAQEGTRLSNGEEFPVFNELMVWKRSAYSTYRVEVVAVSDEARESLERLCEEQGIEFEDWSTVRTLCAACSRGNPEEHSCSTSESAKGPSRFGFAAKSRTDLAAVLAAWRETEADLRVGEAEMLVAGVSQ